MSSANAAALVDQVIAALEPNSRVALIRRVPELFGIAQQPGIYAAVAARVYVPALAPDFAYVHWKPSYELGTLERAYDDAATLTAGFTAVDAAALTQVLTSAPHTLRIFRLLLGLTPQELAASTLRLQDSACACSINGSRIKGIEEGAKCDVATATCLGQVIHSSMSGVLFPPPPTKEVRSKIDKPDTAAGWDTVRRLAHDGVPLPMFLHQRHYGGAFRQLLDATSTQRGDILEEAVEELFRAHRIPFVRTGSANQEEIASRFGLTVRPAPDFVL